MRQAAVEELGAAINPADDAAERKTGTDNAPILDEKCAYSVHPQSADSSKSLSNNKVTPLPRVGIEPKKSQNTEVTETQNTPSIPEQSTAYPELDQEVTKSPRDKIPPVSEQAPTNRNHKKCAYSVHQIVAVVPDLQALCMAWPLLAEEDRAGILGKAKAALNRAKDLD